MALFQRRKIPETTSKFFPVLGQQEIDEHRTVAHETMSSFFFALHSLLPREPVQKYVEKAHKS